MVKIELTKEQIKALASNLEFCLFDQIRGDPDIDNINWLIAQCEWSIRRLQAELDRQADSEGAYAEYVRRSNPHAIRYEQGRINECLAKIVELEGRAA